MYTQVDVEIDQPQSASSRQDNNAEAEGDVGNEDEAQDDIDISDENDDRASYADDVNYFASAYPGREKEFKALYETIRSAMVNGTKICIYVSGVPGTGKTATVHQVIAALKHERRRSQLGEAATVKERRLQRAESAKSSHNDNVLPDFVYVEVNGMRMLDSKQLYVRLYQGLMKAQGFEVSEQVSQAAAEKYIADLFGGNMTTEIPQEDVVTVAPLPPTMKSAKAMSKSKLRAAAENRKILLLVVDELDAFKTARQDIFYKLFEYAQYPQNKFVVITIANTMDLDERHFSARVHSRLAMSKFPFQPYTHEQLTTVSVCRELL